MTIRKEYLKIKSFFVEWARTLDRGLLWAILALIICGIFLTFSASPAVAERVIKTKDTFYFVKKQLFFLFPSVLLMFGVSMLSPKHVRRFSFLIFVSFFILLICTLLFGTEVKGAKRWLYFPGFSIQPSEFIKPAFAVVCAWIFASGRLIKGFPGIPIAGLIYAAVISLLLLQPDFGMSITISAIWGSQLFLAGISFWWIILLSLGALGGVGAAYKLLPHVQSRINRFLNPESGGDSFQVDTSLNALHNAGWFGRGPGEGIIKSKLPDAHTDFILAVAAEEYGFLMSIFVVALFAFIVFRGFYIMSKEKNLFNMLAVAGLLTQFGVQAFINMASTLDLIPTKGMTLPFISYGGSSLLSLAFGLGVILSLTRRHPTQGGLE
ncbi:MAG: putative lipid II flippase FtsW [Alphaproteobacteria bacterium]|nr:putative lipid II flippase FtsW [Alphaproteobacteria bacterium]